MVQWTPQFSQSWNSPSCPTQLSAHILITIHVCWANLCTDAASRISLNLSVRGSRRRRITWQLNTDMINKEPDLFFVLYCIRPLNRTDTAAMTWHHSGLLWIWCLAQSHNPPSLTTLLSPISLFLHKCTDHVTLLHFSQLYGLSFQFGSTYKMCVKVIMCLCMVSRLAMSTHPKFH